jgi:hypothetical protein
MFDHILNNPSDELPKNPLLEMAMQMFLPQYAGEF